PDVPLVLNIHVVLFRPCVDGGVEARIVSVAAEVRGKSLLDGGRNTQHLYDGLLQRWIIGRGDSRRCRQPALPEGLIKGHNGCQDPAAEEPTTVVVVVEAEVESGANGMRSMHPAQVINELRRSNCALRMRGNAVRRSHIDEGAEDALIAPRRQLRGAEVRVGFSECKVESKAVEPGNELIDQVGREYVPVAHGKVFAVATHLAQRSKSGENLRGRILDAALHCVAL